MSEQREIILALFKDPSDFGVLQNPTYTGSKHNASCGDEFTVQLVVTNGKIVDGKFTGTGCAISTASCCLLLDAIKGKKLSDVQKMNSDTIIALLGIPISAGRIKCATLALDIVKHF